MNTAYIPLKMNAIYDDSVRGFGRDTLVRNRSTSRLGDIKSGTNYGHDATGKVTIGTPNDKVVDSQHQSTKPYKVQAKDIPKTKDPKEHVKCRKISPLRALYWTKPKAIIQGV